jgi:multiple sugar transport system permease protein
LRDSVEAARGARARVARPAARGGARHAGAATLLLLAPAAILFALFVLYPIGRTIVLSLYDWNGVGPKTWIGLRNYRDLFADPVFATALANNLRWLACYLIAPIAGLVLALLLNQSLHGMRTIRALFFMPFVISQVVVGLVFGWFFNSRFGLFGRLLELAGGPSAAPLESERLALYTMVVAGLWPQVAYCTILYLAGLAAMPTGSVDAARVDGASGWQVFRRIVLPQLRPVQFIVAMVCAVSALRSFDYVIIMTGGGPYDSSTVLAYYMYEQTFQSLRYGYGAAIAVVLLALMSAIIGLMLWRLFRQEAA